MFEVQGIVEAEQTLLELALLVEPFRGWDVNP